MISFKSVSLYRFLLTATTVCQNVSKIDLFYSTLFVCQLKKPHIVNIRVNVNEEKYRNLRWALDVQTTTARSRNALMMPDIVGFLFGQDDTDRQNLVPCGEDDRKEL